MTGRERANFVNTVRNQRVKSTSSEVEKLVFSTHFAAPQLAKSGSDVDHAPVRSFVFMY